MHASTDGAAIFNSGSAKRILIEFSVFFDCTTSSSESAAIESTGCDNVLNNICGTSCQCTGGNCGFCCNYGNGPDNKNYVHDSSVAYCVASSSYTMYHSRGYIDIKSVNLSHNEASSYSAL